MTPCGIDGAFCRWKHSHEHQHFQQVSQCRTAQLVEADQVRPPKLISFQQMPQVHLLIKHSPSFLRGSATRFLLALIMIKLSISPGSFPRELKSLQKLNQMLDALLSTLKSRQRPIMVVISARQKYMRSLETGRGNKCTK